MRSAGFWLKKHVKEKSNISNVDSTAVEQGMNLRSGGGMVSCINYNTPPQKKHKIDKKKHANIMLHANIMSLTVGSIVL